MSSQVSWMVLLVAAGLAVGVILDIVNRRNLDRESERRIATQDQARQQAGEERKRALDFTLEALRSRRNRATEPLSWAEDEGEDYLVGMSLNEALRCGAERAAQFEADGRSPKPPL